MRSARFWLGIGLLTIALGCDDNDNAPAVVGPTPTATISATATVTTTATLTVTPSASATTTATPIPPGPVALFNVDPLNPANPFPSDRLLDGTGHVHVTGELIGADLPADTKFDTARSLSNMVAQQLTSVTGFSTYAAIRVKLDRPATLATDLHARILILPLDDLTTTISVTATFVTPDIAGDNAIEIRPTIPLFPKAQYAYVVTKDAAHDGDGHPLVAAPDLADKLRGNGLADAATTTWRTTLLPVLSHLQTTAGIGIDDIAAIEFFTTQATTDDLIAIKDLLTTGTLPPADPAFDSTAVPGVTTGIFPEGSPEFTALIGSATSPNVSAVAVGVFDSYDFRTQGVFDPAKINGTVTPSVNHLDFYMTIPKAAPPPGGYPITIFGHGLGGSGRDAVFVSRTIGDAPTMAIGISDVSHGSRGNVANFFNFVNGFVTRENFRQTVADYLQLARMIRHTAVPPFDMVNQDAVRYMGVSLGGIMGTLFMGVDPDVRVGMLSVPGGGLPEIISSQAIGQLLKPVIALTVKIPLNDPLFPVFLHRYFQLAQWFIDPADPINTAPYIIQPTPRLPGVPPKLILMQEGIVDNVVPNFTTDALALAMGLPDVRATRGCASTDGCSGIWRFVMTEYGQDGGDGHSVTGVVPQASAQAGHYVVTAGQAISDASP